LAAYPTRVEDDRVAAEDTSSDPRRRLAAGRRVPTPEPGAPSPSRLVTFTF